MGLLARLLDFLAGRKTKVNVLVVGLDNSGKTTIIDKLKPQRNQSLEVAPTVGFNVESFSKGSLSFTVFDMSGAGKYRNLWERYYESAHAVIFVVDTADRFRMVVAKDELFTLLDNPGLARRCPILVMANKMDVPEAATPVETAETLELQKIWRPWQIVPTNGLTGTGVDQGISWLSAQLTKK